MHTGPITSNRDVAGELIDFAANCDCGGVVGKLPSLDPPQADRPNAKMAAEPFNMLRRDKGGRKQRCNFAAHNIAQPILLRHRKRLQTRHLRPL